MAVTLKDITTNIVQLSRVMDKNIFIENARKSFRDGITSQEVSDEEKAKLIANYEAQISLGVVQEIVQLSKELPEIIAREEAIRADIKVKEKQTKTMGMPSVFGG